MTLGEIFFVLTVGLVAGYEINNYGLDKKLLNSVQKGLDAQTRRSAQIMLQEIDFTFPADAKLDAIVSP